MLRWSLLLLLTLPLRAAEWSQFRGPEGSATAAGPELPANFTAADFAWKVKLPGRGHGSPIAWGGTIFVLSEVEGKPGERAVVAVDAANGQERWRYEQKFEVYPQHKFNSYAASTPCADAERVYVSWLSGTRRQVLALTHEGKKVWEKDLGHWQEDHGSSASPILCEGLLIVPNDHDAGQDAGIFALDPATGAVKWQATTQTARSAFSTPLAITAADGSKQIVVSSNPMALTAFDPKSGKVLWKVDHEVKGARAVNSPVWVDGKIFASVGQGGNGQGSVCVTPGSADGKVAPKLEWEAPKKIPYVPTPVAAGKNMFSLTDGGIGRWVDMATGEAAWEERIVAAPYGSPVRVGNQLWCVARNGEVSVVAADGQFTKLGEGKLGDETHATPAVAAGQLIFRTEKYLLALGGGKQPQP
jgi:outer membrane protein assembly factor BamB